MTDGRAHPHVCYECGQLWECIENHQKIYAKLTCPKCKTERQEGP